MFIHHIKSINSINSIAALTTIFIYLKCFRFKSVYSGISDNHHNSLSLCLLCYQPQYQYCCIVFLPFFPKSRLFFRHVWLHPWMETWHQVWGTEKFSRTKFSNYLFMKFLRTFLVIDCLLLVSTLLNLIYNIYDPFLDENGTVHISQQKILSSHPFLVTSYFPAHPITLLLRILGDRCIGRPLTLNFGGPPVPPKSPPMAPPVLLVCYNYNCNYILQL